MVFRRSLGALALCVAAVGCGGGGGGGGGVGGGGGSGGVVVGGSSTELIPTAPALGATLATDAATLRPIRDGARWSYRGVYQASATSPQRRYETVTQQASTTPGAADETYSNAGNDGSGTQAISIGGGSVAYRDSIDFAGKGVAEVVNFVELRSPVRAGDQYTILDRRYSDTAIDADGDLRPDTLDIVIYGRVVGVETLTLDNLPPLKAVRVDTVIRSRVTLSKTGTATPVVEARIQTWYADGIGIVRQATSTPVGTVSDSSSTDETLVSWDGLTQGYGAMAAVPAVIPATSADYPSRTVPYFAVYAAARLAGGALVATPRPDTTTNDPGALLTRLDLGGNVVSARAHASLVINNVVWAGHAQGLHHLRSHSPELGWLPQLELTRFGPDGALVGSIGGALIDLTGGHADAYLDMAPAMAVDGQTLWILWRRLVPSAIGRDSQLVLRSHTLDGVPTAGESIVDTIECADLALSASGGQALLSWRRQLPETPRMLATAVPGGAPSVSTLFPAVGLFWSGVFPVRWDNHGAVFWPTPVGGTSLDGGAGGVLLDGAGQPLLSGAGNLSSIRLSNVLGLTAGRVDGNGGRLALVSTDTAALWPDGDTTAAERLSWFDTGSTPLDASPQHVLRLPGLTTQRLLAYPDRVLLIGQVGAGLGSTVVWLNTGPP